MVLIRIIWFFIKMALLIGAGVWLATREGVVVMDVMGYQVAVQAGIFFFSLLVLLVALLFLFRLARAIVSVPDTLAKHQEKDKSKKGYRALTRGLVAVAAGDAKKATQFSKQTKSLLPEENGLPVLLEAQAARLPRALQLKRQLPLVPLHALKVAKRIHSKSLSLRTGFQIQPPKQLQERRSARVQNLLLR